METGFSRQKQLKKPRYVRVNTLRRCPDEIIKVLRDEGWKLVRSPSEYSAFLDTISNLGDDEFVKDFHINELLVFPPCAQFYKNELYHNGTLILQDKASCLPVNLLDPPPYSTVLDMCAAPGMKTSHLCAKMKNKGTVYATEINDSRYKTLCEFIRTSGCTNVIPIHADALSIGLDASNQDGAWHEAVEYILVDPSCSGTGMVERNSIFSDCGVDGQRLKKLSAFQYKLLMHALTAFPNAKRVVYSTCSTESSENEKVIDDVVRRLNSRNEAPLEGGGYTETPQFQLVSALEDTWPRRGSDSFQCGKYCIYAKPKKDLTNGFFVAVFDRVQNAKTDNI